MTPPELLDRRYRRVRYIGGGGFGDVYLVHRENLDRHEALKVMKEQFAQDERFVKLFRSEAKITANLDHPNIVTVYDAGEGTFEERRVFYIAMEYVSGGTLKDLIRREGGPLSSRVAVEHTMRVAEALEVAHQSGLIHRDIKPENILLTESGRPKVTDFGIARAASAASSSGLRLATPRYISPEQAEGEPATFRSDLYSLGVVFYEMLTGEVPYDAESAWGVVSQHIRGQLRPPKEVNPNVSKGINQVCVRLLARDPNQRYPDAATLIEDLKAMKDNPDAFVDYMGRTMPLGKVREDAAPTTTLTLSIANLLAELYLQARRLHRAQEWQAVVDVFDRIHALDPEYPDAEGLLVSAREALSAPEPTEQTLSWTNRLSELYAQAYQLLTGQTLSSNRLTELYVQARRLHQAQEWRAVLDVFDQIHALDPAYPDPEGLLVSAREVLAAPKTSITASNAGRVQLLRTMEREEHKTWVGKLVLRKEGHTSSVLSMAFSPDGRLLASGAASNDNTVRLWRAEDGALLRTLEGYTNSVYSVAFSPDGQLLASGSGNTVQLWRVEDGALLRTLDRRHTSEVHSVAFSPDGRLLASGAHDNTARLWRVEDGALLCTLEGHKYSVLSVAFSPDGRLLASGGGDNTVRLWRVEELLASGAASNDNTDRLRWVMYEALLHTLKGHTDFLHWPNGYYKNSVHSVVFSPDGRLLASGAVDNTARLWRVEDGALLRTLEGYSYSVTSVAFSPDGRLLALGSEDTIRCGCGGWRTEPTCARLRGTRT